jgi:tRNA-Thr(GGU) m(6)t(6)A37 methyltransferase TsaA
MKEKRYELKTIGYVESKGENVAVRLNEEYRDALKETEGFSHLQVFWWCHLVDDPEMRSYLVSPKPYKKGPEEVGLFATRSPVRPNPIGVTTVPVISTDLGEGLIRIAFIDAEDGTPVVDIKPYYGMDRVRDLKVPRWCSHWPQWYEYAANFDWEAEFENAQ